MWLALILSSVLMVTHSFLTDTNFHVVWEIWSGAAVGLDPKKKFGMKNLSVNPFILFLPPSLSNH